MANMINPRTGLPMTDAEQSDWARAQGSAAGAASSLGAATQQGQANNQASAGAMANASYGAGMMGPTGQPLTQAEISDMARARGSALGGASSLGANVQQGQANQMAGAGAMNTASNAAAYRANPNISMPGTSGYQPGSFNMPYGTFDNTGQYMNPYATKIPGQQPAGSWMGANGYMNPAAGNPQVPTTQANGITGQMGGFGEIQKYVNPYLDQIIQQGTNAISHSGAGKGLFGSTGNINDIGTWATNTASQAYNDAYGRMNQDRSFFEDQYRNRDSTNRQNYWDTYGANVNANNDAWGRMTDERGFTTDQAWKGYGALTDAGNKAQDNFTNDRSFMADQYWNGRNADSTDYWNTYNANWDQYKYGDAAYNNQLDAYYGQNKNIIGSEQGAADTTGGLYAALGTALAGLYGDQGNAQAAGGIAGANANTGMIGNLLGMFMGGA